MNRIIVLILTVAAMAASCKTSDCIEDPCDMTLVYSGSAHRPDFFERRDLVRDMIVYTDKDGCDHWLFDGFLYLEIFDTVNSTAYVGGYGGKDGYFKSAVKSDWEGLINTYFGEKSLSAALDEEIEKEKEVLGRPQLRHKIYVGIPEPVANAQFKNEDSPSIYWGEVDGKPLDFTNEADRLAACKWFIDSILSKFKNGKYKNLDLVGFYWVDESNEKTKDLIREVSDYIVAKGYGFNWIPYFSANGVTQWKEMGFTRAYYQPNYFFSEEVPYERLKEACQRARENGLDMEMEFDERASAKSGWGYRLRDYMKVYKEEGAWENCALAYYQGGKALNALHVSENPEDEALYHEFCQWLISRPYRNAHK